MAWSYDTVSWLVSLGQWRTWQHAALPHLRGKRILEVAHGPGHMLVELDRKGFQAFGSELSPAMGRQAARNLEKSEQSAPLTRADVCFLPYRSGSFDSVLSTFPAEFIVDPRTILELYRVLVPGGRVVIIPEARLKGGGLVRRFIAWLFTITGQRVEPAEEGWLAQSWIDVEQRIQDAGFSISIEKVDLDESEATVVILTKSAKQH
jgi:ubiquinone/menaquinone biosynthesis C-methylase UbiE